MFLVLYHLHIGHHEWLKCVLLYIIWNIDIILKYPCTQGWPQLNSSMEVHLRLTVIQWWPFSQYDPMSQVFETFSPTVYFKLWISCLIPGHTQLKKRIIYEVKLCLSLFSLHFYAVQFFSVTFFFLIQVSTHKIDFKIH